MFTIKTFFFNYCTGTGAGTDIRTAQKSLYSTGMAHASKAIVRLFTSYISVGLFRMLSVEYPYPSQANCT